jgi:(R,R)-butanediol dehydrogenase/meso-butanediol dehydrogenase/diacetyl reductase
VTQVGAGVTRWKEGDRVIGGGGHAPAGEQPAVRVDPRFNYRTMGFSGNRLRAYAEYVLLNEWEPIPIPDGVTDEQAALCEPCAVAAHAVDISQLKLGDTVAVLGAGPIGLFCAQVARAAGASKVVLSEPSARRREAALKAGVDAVVDPMTENAMERIVELTDGAGPHVLFECAAAPPTLDQALNTVRRGGQVVLVAIAWEPVSVLPADWMAREVKLQASFGSRPENWQTSLRLMQSGQVNVGPMLEEASFVPLDGIQKAFEDLIKPLTQLQMVVKP